MAFIRKEKTVTDNEAKRSLPHNRKEVFFDLIKHRKMNLFSLSCLVFVFFIPLAIDLLYFNFLEVVAITNEKYEYLFSLIFYSMLIMIPCMIVGFLGLAGGFHVAKKMVWQEGIMLSSEFFTGLKENFLHALINGAIFALFLFGLVVGGSYLLIFSGSSPILCGVGIGALIIFFLLFGIAIALFFTQDVYYQNTYFDTLRNSFRFVGLTNWRTLLLFTLTTGALVAMGAINLVTLSVGLFLFAILNSVVIILYTLIAHSAFDKYINVEHYPEMVGKGLYKKEVILTDDKEA